jgi:hypothetical protein
MEFMINQLLPVVIKSEPQVLATQRDCHVSVHGHDPVCRCEGLQFVDGYLATLRLVELVTEKMIGRGTTRRPSCRQSGVSLGEGVTTSIEGIPTVKVAVTRLLDTRTLECTNHFHTNSRKVPRRCRRGVGDT